MDLLKETYLSFKNIHRLYFHVSGVIIGSVDVYTHIPNVVELWSFEIEKEFRNKGFGFSALEAIKKVYKQTLITLYVYIQNKAAVRIYEKAGFVKEDEESNNFMLKMNLKT